MPKQETNCQIPRTRLREIYKLLKTCSSIKFHLEFASELASRKNPEKFASYINEDVKRFHAYENIVDDLFDYSDRSPLPPTTEIEEITNTGHVAALLENQETLEFALHEDKTQVCEFRYVDREVRPCRTTNHATYVDGLPAAAQPHADLLLVGNRNLPSLGEVKIGNDTNPFYALVQLLMYASELLGEHQRSRLSNSFPEVFAKGYRSVDLVIILHKYNKRSKPRTKLLEQTSLLSKRLIQLSKFNKHIRGIYCIDVKLNCTQTIPYLRAEQLFAHVRP